MTTEVLSCRWQLVVLIESAIKWQRITMICKWGADKIDIREFRTSIVTHSSFVLFDYRIFVCKFESLFSFITLLCN